MKNSKPSPSKDTPRTRARAVAGATEPTASTEPTAPAAPPMSLTQISVLVPQDAALDAFKDEVERSRAAISNMEAALIEDMIQLRGLQAVADAVTARIETVRARLRDGLMLTEEKAFECKIGKASISSPPTSVEVFDIAQIPAGMLKMEPDKTKIGALLRAGAAVSGAMLAQKSDKPVLRVAFTKGE